MLWFRIGVNADLDLGSQTNADPCGSGSREPNQLRILADPDPVQTLSYNKFKMYMKNILKVGARGNRSTNIVPANVKVQKPS